MKKFNKYKKQVICFMAVSAVLAAVFIKGGNVSETQIEQNNAYETSEPTAEPKSENISAPAEGTYMPSPKESREPKQNREPESSAPEKSVPEKQQETQNIESTDEKQELKCSISVSCGTVLDKTDLLTPEKAEIIPKNGVIYAENTVEFEEGDTVFDVLLREMKKNGIHMEFKNTPAYNSKYVQGINNLYEHDCGEMSGWMYCVNGEFPNVGCSQYVLKNGDRIEWVYTCNLGKDVKGGYAVK